MATKPRVSIQRANPLFPGWPGWPGRGNPDLGGPGRGNPDLGGLVDGESRKQVVEIDGRMVLVDLITGDKIDLGPITAAPEKSQTSGATPTTWGGMFIDDGQGSGYYADINGRRLNPQQYQEAVAAGRTPAAAAAPRYPEGGVTTTGQTYKIDPYTGDITLGPIYGTLATTRTPQQLRQDVLDDIKAQREYVDRQTAESQRFATSERGAGQTFTTGERLGRQEFDSGEGQLGRQFTSGENTLNRQFQGAESMLGRQFTSGESAIDRAQRAGEFAANYSITKAQAQRQDREAALNAAKTYTELTASPDLTGFQRFLSAGGGSVGNALQRGATSMTREGQLGGARALQVSEQPLPTYMDYNFTPQTNPYAGATNQYMGMTNPYANAMNPVIAIQRAAVPAATIPAATVTPRAVVAPSIDGGSWNPGTSGQSYLDRPNVPDFLKPGYVAPPMPSPASTPAPSVTQAAVPSEGLQWDAGSGFAYGTKVGPIYRLAYGTQDMPRYGFGTEQAPDRGPIIPSEPETEPDRGPFFAQDNDNPYRDVQKWLKLSPMGKQFLDKYDGSTTVWDYSKGKIAEGRQDFPEPVVQEGRFDEDYPRAERPDNEITSDLDAGMWMSRPQGQHLYKHPSDWYYAQANQYPGSFSATETMSDPVIAVPRLDSDESRRIGAHELTHFVQWTLSDYPERLGLTEKLSLDNFYKEVVNLAPEIIDSYFQMNRKSRYNPNRNSTAAIEDLISKINGGQTGKRPDLTHVYTAVMEAYHGDASSMPEQLRRFYPWLNQTADGPRYALGTQDMPVGMDTQFMSGDSTSLDPMSGGARPETVSINDPTGDATFSVDPLQPPDGPSEGGRAAELSSLLKALSQFLDKGEEPAPMPVAPRYAFGTYMMPGYAYGTGIMESDNPYIDRVMAQRKATPYTMNTQAADYSFGSPTLRSINEMGAQVATGVPMVEFGYEANRLRPGMLSRDSLNLGQ